MENNPISSSNIGTNDADSSFSEKTPLEEYNNTSENKYPSYSMNGDNYNNKTENKSLEIKESPLSKPQPPSPVLGTVIPNSAASTQSYSFASFSKRSWAVFIDSMIISFISVLLNIPSYVSLFKNMSSSISTGSQSELAIPSVTSSNPVYTILWIISMVISFIYPVYFIGKFGATPGKKAMKIKVVEIDSKKNPGYLKAFLRETIGKFISSLMFFVGYLWVIWDKDKQAWHDKIAGTVVVNV